MFKLTDSRWSNLRHAYGNASDIPPLLKQLRSFPEHSDYRSEPYFSLWSSLCHQGDVYTGSYAALPHVVAAIEAAPDIANWSALLLANSIEIGRLRGNGPQIPDELRQAYRDAVKRLPSAGILLAADRSDELTSRVAAATIPTSMGLYELADGILSLEPELVEKLIDGAYD
jgi:hypothetical protein